MDGDVMAKRGDFEPGELDRLIAEGERSGKPLKAEEVFKELRELGKRKKISRKRTGSEYGCPCHPSKSK